MKIGECVRIGRKREKVFMSPRFQDAFMYGIRELVGHFDQNFTPLG